MDSEYMHLKQPFWQTVKEVLSSTLTKRIGLLTWVPRYFGYDRDSGKELRLSPLTTLRMRRLFFFLLLGILVRSDGNDIDRRTKTSRGSGNKVDPYKAPRFSVTFTPNLWENWDERRGAWRDRHRYTHPHLTSNRRKLGEEYVTEFSYLLTGRWVMLCNHPIKAKRERQTHREVWVSHAIFGSIWTYP